MAWTKKGNIKGPKGDKGEKGATGPQGPQGEKGATGPQGPQGATPSVSASATVGTGTGTPSVKVTKGGTDASPSFAFAFDGLKGEDATTTATATQSANGLMSSADKKKLDGIAEGANKYTLPRANEDTMGGVQVLDSSSGDLTAAMGFAASPKAVNIVRSAVATNTNAIAKEKMNRYNADTAIKATIPARNNLIFPTALTTKTSGKTVRVTYAGNADIKKLVDQMKTAAVEGQMITAGFIVSFSDSDSDDTYSRGFIPFQDGFGAYKQDGSLLAGTYGGIYKTAAGSFKFREGFDGTYVDLGYSDADSLGQIVADVSRVLGVYWVTFPVSFTV